MIYATEHNMGWHLQAYTGLALKDEIVHMTLSRSYQPTKEQHTLRAPAIKLPHHRAVSNARCRCLQGEG